jgi:hypothetical protein
LWCVIVCIVCVWRDVETINCIYLLPFLECLINHWRVMSVLI